MADLHSFLFLYSDDLGTDEAVKTFVDNCPDIVNWKRHFRILPKSIVLVSAKTADELTDIIVKINKEPKGTFIVLRLDGVSREGRQGYLPASLWSFMNKPSSTASNNAD